MEACNICGETFTSNDNYHIKKFRQLYDGKECTPDCHWCHKCQLLYVEMKKEKKVKIVRSEIIVEFN